MTEHGSKNTAPGNVPIEAKHTPPADIQCRHTELAHLLNGNPCTLHTELSAHQSF